MANEQIKQAANEYRMSLPYCDNPKFRGISIGGYDGFIKGAEWRINSVWHDVANELPECNKHVVNEDWFDFEAKDEKDLKRILKTYPFKRWAYLDDLQPDGKEDGK